MALVPEDGTGIPGANTFATRAELIAYALARGVTLPNTDPVDVFLVLAMDYLESLSYRGRITFTTQLLPFPRIVLNCEDVEVFPSDSVPAAMKKAQLVLALPASQGLTLLGSQGAGRRLKSRDVGPLKRVYADDSLDSAFIAGLSAILFPYLADTATGFRIVTQRA